jgi:UrcA family protein
MNTLKYNHRPSLWSLAFTSLACLLGAAQASADHAIATRSITVNYRDLNLSTIEGATALYQRLKGAAHRVCDEPTSGLDEHRAYQACYRAAIADAVAKVNSPLLTKVFDGPNSKATATAMLTK